jgi:hypothetical protein
VRKSEPITVSEKPFVIPWTERGINWRDIDLPLADKQGWHRSSLGPRMIGENFRFFVQYLPVGQASPWHIADGMEMICFLLEGQIEFGVGPNADDLQYFQVGPYDTLFIPLGAGIDYRNTGTVDARFAVSIFRKGEWPKEVVYQLPGEDKPFVMKT